MAVLPRVLAAVLLSLVVLGGRSSPQASLSIDVKSSYVPGVDFAKVRVAVFASDPSTGEVPLKTAPDRTAEPTADYGTGVHVADVQLSPGTYYVQGQLLSAADTEVGQKVLLVTLKESRSVQLELVRPEHGPDGDGDGFGSDVDCDDTDPAVNPAAMETCGDGVDNNCNGLIDEWCAGPDEDGDGFPDCSTVSPGTPCDCNDCNRGIHPMAAEILRQRRRRRLRRDGGRGLRPEHRRRRGRLRRHERRRPGL